MTEKELNNARIQIAGKLKAKREDLGLSHATLSEKTGLDVATIQRFEMGKFWLGMKHYVILREALGLSMDF